MLGQSRRRRIDVDMVNRQIRQERKSLNPVPATKLILPKQAPLAR